MPFGALFLGKFGADALLLAGAGGVQAVGGTTSAPLAGIAEEPHIVPIQTTGGYYVVFRTSDGWLGTTHSISAAAAMSNTGWANSSFAEYLAYAPWMSKAEVNNHLPLTSL